jgi:hypothetical protein
MANYALKIVAKGSLLAQDVRNIFWFRYYCPSGVPNPVPDVTTHLTSLYTTLFAYITPHWVMNTFEWYWVTEGVGNTLVFGGEAPLTGVVGSAVVEQLPNQMAPVLIGKVLGRRGFGRKFLAGFTVGALHDGVIIAGALSALGNALLIYISPFGSYPESFTPGVCVHPKLGTYTIHSFTSGVITNLFGTERRRKIGVGM